MLTSRKPIALAYTAYLDECVSSIAAASQRRSDTILLYHIRALHIAEQAAKTFDQGSEEGVNDLNDDRLQILLKTFEKQIEDFRLALPMNFSDSDISEEVSAKKMTDLHGIYHRCRAALYEPGLYGLLEGESPSLARITMIYECFISSMEYLSMCLKISLKEMTDWTSLDWRCLNCMVMLALRSSIILETCSPSIEESQRAASLDKCLGTLYHRIEELQLLVGVTLHQDNYFRKLSADWANAKAYHERCVRKNLNQATSSIALTPMTSQPDSQFVDNQFDMNVFNDFLYASYGNTESILTYYSLM